MYRVSERNVVKGVRGGFWHLSLSDTVDRPRDTDALGDGDQQLEIRATLCRQTDASPFRQAANEQRSAHNHTHVPQLYRRLDTRELAVACDVSTPLRLLYKISLC